MCDFDDNEPASFSEEKIVKKRTLHRCLQCRRVIPPKNQMLRWNIGWDGTAGTFYVCLVCHWMSKQPESSPFHICLSTAGDDDRARVGQPEWEEVKSAQDEGREPNPNLFASSPRY